MPPPEGEVATDGSSGPSEDVRRRLEERRRKLEEKKKKMDGDSPPPAATDDDNASKGNGSDGGEGDEPPALSPRPTLGAPPRRSKEKSDGDGDKDEDKKDDEEEKKDDDQGASGDADKQDGSDDGNAGNALDEPPKRRGPPPKLARKAPAPGDDANEDSDNKPDDSAAKDGSDKEDAPAPQGNGSRPGSAASAGARGEQSRSRPGSAQSKPSESRNNSRPASAASRKDGGGETPRPPKDNARESDKDDEEDGDASEDDDANNAGTGPAESKHTEEGAVIQKEKEDAYIPLWLAKKKLHEFLFDMHSQHSNLLEDIDETYHTVVKETQEYFLTFTEHYKDKERKRTAKNRQLMLQANRDIVGRLQSSEEMVASLREKNATLTKDKAAQLEQSQKEARELEDRKNEELHQAKESMTKQHQQDMEAAADRAERSKATALEDLTKAKDAEIAQLEQSKASEISQLKADHKKEIVNQDQELEKLKAKVRGQQDEIDQLQTQCDQLQMQLKTAAASGGSGGAVAGAGAVDASAQIQVFELQSQLRKEKRVQERREEELDALKKEHAKLSEEYKTFLKEVQSGSAGDSGSVGSAAPVPVPVPVPAGGGGGEVDPAEKQAIEDQINEKKNQLADLEKKHSTLGKKKKVLKKEIFVWTKDFEAREGRQPTKDDREDIKPQLAEYKDMDKQLSACGAEKTDVEKEIEALEAKLAALESQGSAAPAPASGDAQPQPQQQQPTGNASNAGAIAALKLQLVEKDEQIRDLQAKHRVALDEETRKSGKDDVVVEDLKKQLVTVTEERNKLAAELQDAKANGQSNGDNLRASGGPGSTQLKQRVAQLENQNAKLKARLDEAKEKGFDDGAAGDDDDVSGGDTTAIAVGGGVTDEALVEENEDLREQIERASREVTAAEEKLAAREEQYETSMGEKSEEITKLRSELTKAQTEGLSDSDAAGVITSLREDKSALETEVEDLRAVVQTKDDEIVELRNNTAAPVFNFAADSDDERDDTGSGGGGGGGGADPAELAELRSQLDAADEAHDKEIADLRSQLEHARAGEASEAGTLAEKDAEIKAMKDEADARVRSLQVEVEQLKTDLAKAEQAANDSRVSDLESQIATAQAKGEDTSKLESDLEASKKAAAEAEKEAAAKLAAAEEASSKAKSEDEAKIAELNAEVAKLTSAYAKLDADYKKVERERDNAQADLKKKSTTGSKRRTGAAAAAGAAGGSAAANKENAKLKRELTKLANQLKKTEDKLRRAQSSGGAGGVSRTASSGGGGGSGGMSSKEAAKLELSLRKAEQKIEQQQKKISQLEDKIKNTPKGDPKKEAQLEAKAGKAESKMQKQLDDANAKAAKDLESLEKKKNAEIEKLKKELENATASSGEAMNKLKSDLKEANKSLKDTEAELNEVKGQLAALQKESQADKEELESLRVAAGEAAALQSRVGELESEVEKSSKKYAQLEENFQKEALLRKKYHNIIEDLKGKIRVIVRARPLSKKELARGCASVVNFPDAYTINIDMSKGTKSFTFDTAFGPDSTQLAVFEDVKNLCLSAMDGYNVCIFAYGQTGSGKTFTMAGEGGDLEGITPRAMREIYTLANNLKKRATVTLKAYMMELYNDKLVDLLQKNKKKPPKLDIKKDAKGMIFVNGSVLREAPDAPTLQAIIDEGSKNRHVAATAMNEGSSRSHLILGIVIESIALKDKKKTVGKLSLVDLAGSERVGKTGATADRLKEAQAINRSLSALGDVISALSTEEKFIPYRNNKLTLLMSDSLGGNAKTLMFVNISPADYNMDESFLSMSYAQRVKMITNDATKNVENKEVQKLKKVIAKLRAAGAAIPEEDDVEQTLTVDEVAFENQKESVHDLELANKTVGSEGPNAKKGDDPPDED